MVTMAVAHGTLRGSNSWDRAGLQHWGGGERGKNYINLARRTNQGNGGSEKTTPPSNGRKRNLKKKKTKNTLRRKKGGS